jgi:hypothetical protein
VQQDRWSGGAARGVGVGYRSTRRHRTTRALPASRCAGDNLSNNADYARATTPDVLAQRHRQMSLGVNGFHPAAGSSSAVVRSTDGDATGARYHCRRRTVLQRQERDRRPTDSLHVRDGRDRLTFDNRDRPCLRTPAMAVTWEPARVAYDPASTTALGAVVPCARRHRPVQPCAWWQQQRDEADRHPLTDKGLTWSPRFASRIFAHRHRDRRPASQSAMPARCRNTVGPQGVLVATCGRTLSSGARDAVVTVPPDNGLTWSAPVQVSGAPFTPQ